MKRTASGLTLVAVTAMPGLGLAQPAPAGEPVDIGSRRELFVDELLIVTLDGAARQTLHHPTPREVVLVCDRPWEGNGLNYVTVFRDGDLYKMYYRGGDYDRGCSALHEQVYCYAESRDGVQWERPNLGLVDFRGSKENNIIISEKDPELGGVCHNFSPFIDRNPAAPASERYKAIGGGPLFALVSPDGIHWTKAAAPPIITVGDFDSHNLAFWDVLRQEYRAYHRKFRDGRDVMTETSASFTQGWTEPVFLEYAPGRGGELYTNQVTQYERAPHYFLGFPTRYEDRGLTPSTKYLPQWDYRQSRSALSPREGTAVTEGLFMASRDGRSFGVFQEAFVRPGLRTRDSWFYGDNYQNWGLVETASAVAPDAPNELSIYLTEGTLQNGKPAKLRRYTLRLDGFVSISAPMSGGGVQTRPIRFAGSRLTLNYSSSARGGIRVGLNAADGQPAAGLALDDCPWIYGDALDRPVEWRRDGKETTDVSAWAGKPVRLVFELRDADLYSFKFE
jgi:hypothetical protein